MSVLKTYRYPVDKVGGVAFDGQDVWFAYKGKRDALARVDRTTGRIRNHLRGPKIGSGTAWDGKHLWQIGEGTIQCVDAETGKVLRTLPVPDEGFISGLAWDGEALWAGAFDRRRLYKIHPKTGKVLKMLHSDRYVTGIAWVGDELWHAVFPEEKKRAEIRRLDSRNGKVLRRHPVSYTISGMAHDGERFWCGDCKTATLRAVTIDRRKS